MYILLLLLPLLTLDWGRGSLIDPAWFALDVSRGYEDAQLKMYMRATVLVSEYLVYVPAIVAFLRRYARSQGIHTWSASMVLVAVLLQPATLLIDHGHFQYNTVMLGLAAASLWAIHAGRILWSCVFFVGALGFKQMALYYAPVMFAFLLGECVAFPRVRVLRLLAISVVTLLAFGALFGPLLVAVVNNNNNGELFVSSPLPPLMQLLPVQWDRKTSIVFAPVFQLTQVIHRLFPFSRGIFEDKVANAWCAIHTFYKLNSRFPQDRLQKFSLAATLSSIIAPCAIIFRHPRPSLLLLSLSCVSWGFFLFSFQVHEKSVLVPLLPMTLLLSSKGGLSKPSRAWIGWANMLGSWTLFPLLKRDGLAVPYFVMTLLWAYLLGLPPTSLAVYRADFNLNNNSNNKIHILTKLIHSVFYTVMISWHFLEALVPPPIGKPDLWVVANVLVGAAGFGIVYLWCLYALIVQSCKLDQQLADEGKRKKKH